MRMPRIIGLLLWSVWAAGAALAAPSMAERLSDKVWVVRDDGGTWSGDGSKGITHQCGPEYWAKKVLDLSNVPQDLWNETGRVRLSVFFCVRDYSWHDTPDKKNGLDESVEVVVNGKVHSYPTAAGLPEYGEKKPMTGNLRWHDFALPKEEFVRGPNEIILKKAVPAGKKPDDYLYLGIDTAAPGGNSWVKFGADTNWQQDKLTIPGGKGEYMVRLYLIRGETAFEAAWLPSEGRTKDDLKVLDYAGAHGDTARMEWDPLRLDTLSPITAVIETAEAKDFSMSWLDADGKAVTPPVKLRGPRAEATLTPPMRFTPSGLELDKGLALRQVALRASLGYHPLPRRVDMAPHMAPPKGAEAKRFPWCQFEWGKVTLSNANLRCVFKTEGKLQLASLYNELAAAEMVRKPEECALFMVEVGDKRYAGSRDFECRLVLPMLVLRGFHANLFCKEAGLEARLSVWADDALRMGLEITNRADKPVDLKAAFPHFAGLAISDNFVDDYYFYPWGGGIFSDAPAILRRGYGDHEALYQMMDLYSPNRGAGLAVWCADTDGRHKKLALRKHVPGEKEMSGEISSTPTSDEFKWTNSLPEVPGIGLAYEYLRRTREPGKSFLLKDAALQAHPGDWHVAMKSYADWCHKIWKFRPYPSRLGPVVNMIAVGWGQSPLFRDGAYRTDFIKPMTDCIELMSWWDWSPLGPWSTPFDRLKEVMTDDQIKRWQPYFIKDPVTGHTMWNNQPGDYDGYNERFGGLPAFRRAIQTYQEMGSLVTLYTDPFRMDDASKIGRKYGKAWGVVKPDGEYSRAYEVWNPCHDVADVRQWVADAMGRVMRETGADGIRLDEYGHRGWACFNKLHKHTYAEWGCTEWQRAVAEATKMVRKAMDEAKPGSVLTTEHPGYDFLMQYLEGCITYDLTVQATPMRPLECNLQKFYFPECKPYELDHAGADRQHRKRFWNAVASFGSYYPLDMYTVLQENSDAFESRAGEPMIPTLARYVYANRFSAGRKALTMLYNATGHSFEGVAVEIPVAADEHLFDLLGCREVAHEAGKVRVFIPRDNVLCVGRLPKEMEVKRNGRVVEVTVKNPGSGLRICVSNRNGEVLLTQAAGKGPQRFELAEEAMGASGPVCVKLLRGGLLVDVVALPPAQPPS